jgi:hypothetical protein
VQSGARWAAGAASHLSTILAHDPAPAGVTAEMLQHSVDAMENEDDQAGTRGGRWSVALFVVASLLNVAAALLFFL